MMKPGEKWRKHDIEAFRTPSFSPNGNYAYGGDSACPPEPPLCLAIALYYLLRNYRNIGRCQSGGGGATWRSPQERYEYF
jgi:hypothetical protein